MADEAPTMTLKPIGFVRSEVKQTGRHDSPGLVSEIIINSSLTEALDGLEAFSHIIVLYWMHKVTEEEMPFKVHPMRRKELPLIGLFATRSPNRPNPIGETIVRLLQRQYNVLRVEGLDAIDGTPVIDIKPYIPGGDSVAEARVPKWIERANQ